MNLKILSWNVRKANKNSPVWEIISTINPDLITLQEVVSISNSIKRKYSVYYKSAISEKGKPQIFSTAILVKGEISQELQLQSDIDWVNNEIEYFKGNLLLCEVLISGLFPLKVVSVYSPAWPVRDERLKDIDISEVKLKLNPKVWCTEILWSALKTNTNLKNENWIVAGDFNSSVTFDYLWKGGPHGNQEIIDRMKLLGLTECLYYYSGKLVPTFKNPKGGKIIHQIDHMYITENLLKSLQNSNIGNTFSIFEKSISDHLPIITNLNIET